MAETSIDQIPKIRRFARVFRATDEDDRRMTRRSTGKNLLRGRTNLIGIDNRTELDKSDEVLLPLVRLLLYLTVFEDGHFWPQGSQSVVGVVFVRRREPLLNEFILREVFHRFDPRTSQLVDDEDRQAVMTSR